MSLSDLQCQLLQLTEEHLVRLRLVIEGIVTEPDAVREIRRAADEFREPLAKCEYEVRTAIREAGEAFVDGWPTPTEE